MCAISCDYLRPKKQLTFNIDPLRGDRGERLPDLKQNGISLEHLQLATALFNLPAFLVVALLTVLLVKGIHESAAVNSLIVATKVAVILVVIGVGAAFVRPSNWMPFVPPNLGKLGEFGWSGMMRGAAVVFFAYIGFDAVSTAAQESLNPSRDVPIGILGSLIFCSVLYVSDGLGCNRPCTVYKAQCGRSSCCGH